MEDLAPSRQGGGSAGQVQLPKEDTAEKPSKSTNTRQRVSVACLPCRKRRMRCDGIQPICGSCASKGVDCEYQSSEHKRKPPSKRYVESLLARIKHLEDQLAALGKTAASLPAYADAKGSLGDPDATEDDERHSSEHLDQCDPTAEVSMLMGRLNVGSDGQLHYFGPQSNYNLIRSQLADATSVHYVEMQRQGLDAAARLNKDIHVSEELRDHLLDLYWKWQNPWNYILHKEAFTRDLRAGSGKFCSPLLLLAVLALASRYSDRIEIRTDPENPNTAGNAFSDMAKILLLYESEAPTVTTVQAASLLSLRAISDNQDALGWLYCGNATRMAFNLGLNLECSKWVTAGLISEEEAEIRKIAWWGCYNLDKLFAMALGRPGTTRKSHATCPLPSINPDDEYGPWLTDVHGTNCGPAAHSRIVSAAHSILESLTIASEAMDDIYAPKNALSEQLVESVIGKADIAMNMYYASLPSFLRLPASPRVSTLPHIYHLHIQYHVGQILLHRPLIQRQVSKESNDSAPPQIDEENSHMKACRHSATEISKILRNYGRFYSLRLVPIVSVHNTFTAAVIHLLDLRPRPGVNRRRTVQYLKVCVNALRVMRVAWCSWSSRALGALGLLAKEWLIEDVIEVPAGSSPEADNSRTEAAVESTETHPASASPASPIALFGDPVDDMDVSGLNLDFLFDDIPNMQGSELDGILRSWLGDDDYSAPL